MERGYERVRRTLVEYEKRENRERGERGRKIVIERGGG